MKGGFNNFESLAVIAIVLGVAFWGVVLWLAYKLVIFVTGG